MYLLITVSLAVSLVAATTLAAAENEQLLRMPLIRGISSRDILASVKRKHVRLLDKRDPFKNQLYNDQGSQYLIQVGIGTPPQNFTVTLDTGSADLWVPSSQCAQDQCPLGGFDESKSSSFNPKHQPFGIQYGIGSVNGSYASDTVTVAGATVPNQQFGLAMTTQDILTDPATMGSSPGMAPGDTPTVVANGILGLGYPQLTAATNQGDSAYSPFVFNLVDQQVIKEPVFSVYMNSADKVGWAGEIIFGGADQSKYQGDLQYLPVVQLPSSPNGGDGSGDGDPFDDGVGGNGGNNGNGDGYGYSAESVGRNGYFYWMVYGQSVMVAQQGQKPQNFPLDNIGAFILDTGTTLTYLPTNMAVKIITALAGDSGFQVDRQSGIFVVDCNLANSAQEVQFAMSPSKSVSPNPVVLSVPVSQLVIPLDGDTATTASTCMFGIAPLGGASSALGNNVLLVGDSVLRSAYLVFDMGKNQVGIAAAQGMPGSVSTAGASISKNEKNLKSAAATLFRPSPGLDTLIFMMVVLLYLV